MLDLVTIVASGFALHGQRHRLGRPRLAIPSQQPFAQRPDHLVSAFLLHLANLGDPLAEMVAGEILADAASIGVGAALAERSFDRGARDPRLRGSSGIPL